MSTVSRTNGANETLERLLRYSDYARRMVAADPAWREWIITACREPMGRATPAFALGGRLPPSLIELNAILRRQRTQTMLGTMARDVAEIADFNATVKEVTDLAKWAVNLTTAWHAHDLTRRHGTPVNADGSAQSLITVGMGKLGGEELNVSSDIDLIFLFPEAGETTARSAKRRIDNTTFFSTLAARASASLSEIDENGFVFRVDTRLRPYGDDGPLAVSFDFLEGYLVEQGRFWERLAWLRSASMTGDTPARKQLSELVRPFVYRRYFDYDAYAGLRDLHSKIRAEGHRNGGDANIKLGRGGIRELEFFVQVQQLVRGGREPSLRQRKTIPAIDALERLTIFNAKQAHGLREAYPLLRRIEHFLQYQDDQQTQTLPSDAAAQAEMARAMGFASADAFMSRLHEVRQFVAMQFDNMAQAARQGAHPGSAPPPPAIDRDPFASWDEADEARRYFAALAQSNRLIAIPAQSRARLELLWPKLIAACASTPAPLPTLKRWGDLIEAIAGRSAYLALLAEHETLLEPITRVLAASPWAAEYLRDHPILLDELLDARARDAEIDYLAWPTALREKLAHDRDTEAKLDTLRRFQQAELFSILLADLAGELSVERLSDLLSALADAVVGETLTAVWHDIAPQQAFPHFAVIAYGRWGGKELGYGSDLDLIFLIDDNADNQRCAKLAQRTQTWLTTTTSAGKLYEVDTRLRPDGASGLLLSTDTAFEDYQRHHAWRWEHQALSRARFAAGDAAVGASFERIRKAILSESGGGRQTRAQIVQDILGMRLKMHAEKPSRAGRFDVKNDSGGMIDIEFIVQMLVLTLAHAHPFLIENKGNIALLHYAGETRLLPKADADAAADAYRRYRAFQHQSRLAGEERASTADDAFLPERKRVQKLWDACFSQATLKSPHP